MAHVRPTFMTRSKAPFLAALLFLFSLSACSLSWITDPVARTIQKKTGIEIKWEEISLEINPLHLEVKGIRAVFKQGRGSWEVKIQDLQTVFGWSLSWENLPWPDFHIEKVLINRPRLLIQLPEPGKGGDWAAWLKKCPALNHIEVKDLSGRIELGKNFFQFSPGTQVSASFSPDQGGEIEYRIRGLQGRWAAKGIEMQAGSHGSIKLSDFQDQPKWNGDITLSHGNLIFPQGKAAELSGTFHFLYRPPLLEISTSSARAQAIQWVKDDLSFQGRGTMILSGSIQNKKGKKEEALFSKGALKFDALDFDLKQGKGTIRGKVDGQVQISGLVTNPFLRGSLRSRQTDLDLSPVHAQGMDTEILFEGSLPNLSFPLIRGKAPRFDWRLTSDTLSVIRPEARCSAQLSEGGRKVFLKDVELKTNNWGNLSGSLVFDPSIGPVPSGKVQADGFPLPGFLKLFFPHAAKPFTAEIPCQGTFEWTREAAGSPFVFHAALFPASFSFHFPGTDWQGEKLKTRIEARGKWFLENRKVQWILQQDLSGGTLFRPPWRFPFDQSPLTARLEGTFQGGGQTATLQGSLGIKYDPLGEVKASGEGLFGSDSQSYSGSIEVNDLPLEKGFPLLAGGPLSDRQPFLKTLSPQGLLKAALFISKRNKAYELRGRLTGSGIELTSQDPSLSLKDMAFDLPFDLSSPGTDPGKILYSESGFFQVERFQGSQIVVNHLRFPVLARTNHFEVPDKIEIPLWGGRLALSSFKLTDPLGDLKMESALSLKGLDLNQMVKGLKIPGTVSGDLGPVRIDREKARIEGTVKAQVFEGTVEGKNWVVLKPFSQERVIQGDLFFDHLNLESLTERFSFGKITGYIQGQMTGLALRSNRPERFNLQVRTREVPGVPKKIQVKAIENINLLGTGWGEMSVLRQGLNRFITDYDYREIGLACLLQEDRLSLRGTVVEEGVEYLVRSPGWFGIDIINKNPDNEISFSDIMDRIHRIGMKPQEGNGDEKK